MNYRHLYHAGNFADVFKHCILILLIEALCKKDKPFCYLDAHAGIGSYNLDSANPQKTREYENGIARLYNHAPQDLLNYPKVISTYLDIVHQHNTKRCHLSACTTTKQQPSLLHFYPGSPFIVQALLRPQDSMILVELHPEDVQTLQQEFAINQLHHKHHIAIHHADAYQSLKAFLPPLTGRGLILIDPPFEQKDEYQKIINALQVALQRFSAGIYAIWYPIKDQTSIENFLNGLKKLPCKNILNANLILNNHIEMKPGNDDNANRNSGLTGCGMAIINAPWQFEQQLQPVLAWLCNIFATNQSGRYNIKQLLLNQTKN